MRVRAFFEDFFEKELFLEKLEEVLLTLLL